MLKQRGVLLFIFLIFLSCATTPKPLKYLSRTKPQGVIKTKKPVNYQLNKMRAGFLYRKPVDISNYLKEAEKQTNNKILRNTDVLLQVPFCYFFLCFGNDRVVIKEKIEKQK